MSIRYVSRPRRRSGILIASSPSFTAVGSGSASNPVFTGDLIASLASPFSADGAGTFSPAGGSTGEFDPTHYVTADASGSGNGTLGSPYTLAQACALAQPGWVVELAPGIYIGPNRGNNSQGSFQIANNGTEAQPIVFFCRNYASLNETGRSILQHSGTVQGSGCPVLRVASHQHWYGPYINEDQAPTFPDTGPVVVLSATGAHIKYFRINRGSNVWPVTENNHAAVRFEGNGCRGNIVSDCFIENYSGIGWNGSEQGVQVYGPTDALTVSDVGQLIVENNVFVNCQYALTLKSINNRLIDGGIIFRRNLVSPSAYMSGGQVLTGAVNFIGVGNTLGRNQVYQNIQFGGSHCVAASQQIYPVQDLDVVNNTCVDLLIHSETTGVLSTRGDNPGPASMGSGWRMHNNIKTGTAMVRKFPYDDSDVALQSASHNYGYLGTSWAHHPDVAARSGLLTLAQWVASTDWDDFSSTANPLLVSSTWGNADLGKLQAGSPCRNAGVDLLNLHGGGTSAACHIGAYSNDGVVIGIRPLT